ncbi:hypothetical protein [Nostoc spongiaeforme]|uniref:DUF2808 domain-containing protein n=1 Tax=Nostoc spongiaeforme FACHB-130 TaxID=1357510 RepID=A0ABR8G2U8_9NOSO|nr:hypothetical protein [Nostoc spongiaeforme]MBD2597494.1 hypothetical protein [Nostoc spongiaeforme FACHB-130]
MLIYVAVCNLAITSLSYADYAIAKTDNDKLGTIEDSSQYIHTGWQLVKQTFQLHIPKNGKPISQLIIDVPPKVAVTNDVDVLDEQGQKIKINILVSSQRIIIDFPELVTSSTSKLQINFNKVLQPITGSLSIYHLSAKVVGSDVEIPVGEVQIPSL